jgi:hypothetical protein
MGALTALLALAAMLVGPNASSAATFARSNVAFSKTEKISRVHLVNGKSQVVDRRTFSLKVDQTTDLRDRQEIDVSWTGAHPTGGILPDPNAASASQQEYPVVLMMCHGLSSPSAPASKRISPQTCWTQTPGERVQISGGADFPPYRLDRYAAVGDRALSVNVPKPYPKKCPAAPSAQHWVPFVAASGKVYPGGVSTPSGTLVCNAGIPPEQASAAASLQPGNTTYATSSLKGNGSTKFVISTAESNASLGCSQSQPCSLVVIPIMGISCDPAGDSLPPIDRPPTATAAAQAFQACSETGAYQPGEIATQTDEVEDLAVSGELWWSASNWRNRIAVPLSFAPPSNECALVNKSAPTDIYGSYLLFQATQQWAPHFCLNPKLFALQHVQTSEPEAKNLLESGSIDAAFQGSSPPTPFTKPVVQAPTAVTGFAVVFDISSPQGHQFVRLNLDARLLAKLLTESYPSNPTMQQEDKALWNPHTHQPNPVDMASDPEFQALNPDLPKSTLSTESASTILAISSDSDIMSALTSYINADPEARAWLNGKPDPWGMIVNPAYKGIKLPVDNFPLRDTFDPPGLYRADRNACLADVPSPWLPLVASPVENPATITLDLQFDIANSQIECSDPGATDQKLTSVGREAPDRRFVLGITSIADARRYQLDTAALETQGGSTSSAKFTSSKGRSFATPSDASLKDATALLAPDKKSGSWPMPYAKLRTATAGKSAYPGTMLVSTDVPTSGIPPAVAKDLAKFLDFVASDGQHPGLGNGQLPPGYLPLTAANGLGNLVDFTKAAAVDVAAQNGDVPSLTNPSPGGGGGSPSPTPTDTTSSGTGPGGDTTPPPVKSPSSGGPSSPTVAPSQSAMPSTTTTVSLGRTAAVTSTTANVIFPLVLLLALIAGTATMLLWRFDRPRVSR